jgi:hypothetical protein
MVCNHALGIPASTAGQLPVAGNYTIKQNAQFNQQLGSRKSPALLGFFVVCGVPVATQAAFSAGVVARAGAAAFAAASPRSIRLSRNA